MEFKASLFDCIFVHNENSGRGAAEMHEIAWKVNLLFLPVSWKSNWHWHRRFSYNTNCVQIPVTLHEGAMHFLSFLPSQFNRILFSFLFFTLPMFPHNSILRHGIIFHQYLLFSYFQWEIFVISYFYSLSLYFISLKRFEFMWYNFNIFYMHSYSVTTF